MKSIFEQNGGTYTKVGNYYVPNISVPDTKKYNIGKYGNLRKAFLKEHHKTYYTILFMEAKLQLSPFSFAQISVKSYSMSFVFLFDILKAQKIGTAEIPFSEYLKPQEDNTL